MSILITILMIGLGFIAMWLLRKGAKAMAAMCSMVILILVMMKLVIFGEPRGNDAVMEQLDRHQQVLGAYVGRDVARRHPGKRVLIVEPPEPHEQYQPPVGSAWLTASLTRALVGGGLQVESMPLPISEDAIWYDTEQLNALLSEFKNRADVVVFTFEAPRGFIGPDLLKAGSAPDLVIVNAHVEDAVNALTGTVLDAVVIRRHPSKAWSLSEPIPKNDDDAFNNWYLLLSRNNVSSLAEQASQRY